MVVPPKFFSWIKYCVFLYLKGAVSTKNIHELRNCVLFQTLDQYRPIPKQNRNKFETNNGSYKSTFNSTYVNTKLNNSLKHSSGLPWRPTRIVPFHIDYQNGIRCHNSIFKYTHLCNVHVLYLDFIFVDFTGCYTINIDSVWWFLYAYVSFLLITSRRGRPYNQYFENSLYRALISKSLVEQGITIC